MSTPLARSLAELPPIPEDVRKWRILLLVSAANSLTQRVMTYLSDLGCEKVSTELALSDESMISAVLAHSPHVVLCPFLTKKVPDVIWENVSETLPSGHRGLVKPGTSQIVAHSHYTSLRTRALELS